MWRKELRARMVVVRGRIIKKLLCRKIHLLNRKNGHPSPLQAK